VGCSAVACGACGRAWSLTCSDGEVDDCDAALIVIVRLLLLRLRATMERVRVFDAKRDATRLATFPLATDAFDDEVIEHLGSVGLSVQVKYTTDDPVGNGETEPFRPSRGDTREGKVVVGWLVVHLSPPMVCNYLYG
jgi:hypothetical protein